MIKKILNNLDLYFTILILVIMEIMMTLQVFFRYVLRAPFHWSDAFCAYGLVLIVCFGSIYVYRKKNNLLGFYALRNVLPRIPRLILNIIYRVVATIIFGLITCSFFLTVVKNPTAANQAMAGLPYWAYFGPGIISFGIMSILSIIYMVRDIRLTLAGKIEFHYAEGE
jgi:TRAP-type C4-dicarboxylate transport system permease small subunit